MAKGRFMSLGLKSRDELIELIGELSEENRDLKGVIKNAHNELHRVFDNYGK